MSVTRKCSSAGLTALQSSAQLRLCLWRWHSQRSRLLLPSAKNAKTPKQVSRAAGRPIVIRLIASVSRILPSASFLASQLKAFDANALTRSATPFLVGFARSAFDRSLCGGQPALGNYKRRTVARPSGSVSESGHGERAPSCWLGRTAVGTSSVKPQLREWCATFALVLGRWTLCIVAEHGDSIATRVLIGFPSTATRVHVPLLQQDSRFCLSPYKATRGFQYT